MQKLLKSIRSKKSILFLTICTVLSIGLIQYTETLAQDTSNGKYVSADEVVIYAIFDLHEGPEASNFEIFQQISGFDQATEKPQFKLERIVGDTPLLHKAVDMTLKYKRASQHDWKFFDVKVIISQGSKQLRNFDYSRCQFTDYDVWTYNDPNEAWTTSQGFATADRFELTCDGYKPISPTYEIMMEPEKANNVSSLDLEEGKTMVPP